MTFISERIYTSAGRFCTERFKASLQRGLGNTALLSKEMKLKFLLVYLSWITSWFGPTTVDFNLQTVLWKQ